MSIAASNLQPGAHEVNTNDMTTHYVFDYSQMFSVPPFSQLVGSLYFIIPRKMFWYNSSIPLQTNFLLDEDSTIGKDGTRCHGPNGIICLIYRYLQKSLTKNNILYSMQITQLVKTTTRPCFIICHGAVTKDEIQQLVFIL